MDEDNVNKDADKTALSLLMSFFFFFLTGIVSM